MVGIRAVTTPVLSATDLHRGTASSFFVVLCRCGLDHVTYLIEEDPDKAVSQGGFGLASAFNKASQAQGARFAAFASTQARNFQILKSSMASTQIINEFHLVNTSSIDDTIKFLARMHAAICERFVASCACACVAATSAAAASSSSSSTSSSAAPRSTTVDWLLLPMLPASCVESDVDAAVDAADAACRAASTAASLRQSTFSLTTAQVDAVARGEHVWPIGAGASTRAPAHGSGSGSGSSVGGFGHLCSDDRCNLWGRPCMPRVICTYTEWDHYASRARNVTALMLFGSMLRQVERCGTNKAQAVLDSFTTPRRLLDAYDALEDPCAEGPEMLTGK